jgi:hypothetical protein
VILARREAKYLCVGHWTGVHENGPSGKSAAPWRKSGSMIRRTSGHTDLAKSQIEPFAIISRMAAWQASVHRIRQRQSRHIVCLRDPPLLRPRSFGLQEWSGRAGGRCVTGRIVVQLYSLTPGCRFAGRSTPRASGKLTNIWSPDAVNDVGRRDDCAVSVAPHRPGASGPHGRFAGRLIPRPPGKLADVWSPDAVHDAGGIDGCAVSIVPCRHGRSSEHGRSDQSCRQELTHCVLL